MRVSLLTFFVLFLFFETSLSATLSGSVSDLAGNPVAGAAVTVYKRINTVGVPSEVNQVLSDSLGNFSLTNVDTGEYYISAADLAGNLLGTFYPSSLSWNESLSIDVQSSSTLIDTLDFNLSPLNKTASSIYAIQGALSITSTSPPQIANFDSLIALQKIGNGVAGADTIVPPELWIIAQSDSILTNGQMVANNSKFGFSRTPYDGTSTFVFFNIQNLQEGKYKIFATLPGIWSTYYASDSTLNSFSSIPEDKATLINVPQVTGQFVLIIAKPVQTQFLYGNIFDEDGNITCNGEVINFIGNQVDVGDSKLILNHSTQCINLNVSQQFVADVDGDRMLTPKDASLILQKLNGTIQCFPVECNN
ncbi:MAG: carboxypeptidase regulatory-like domain-containing protein [Calditrichaeota bacterium]|nr:MAG: carboxypeptidase regulatory-like domain-containing protein [Calditrichota bacterium]